MTAVSLDTASCVQSPTGFQFTGEPVTGSSADIHHVHCRRTKLVRLTAFHFHVGSVVDSRSTFASVDVGALASQAIFPLGSCIMTECCWMCKGAGVVTGNVQGKLVSQICFSLAH